MKAIIVKSGDTLWGLSKKYGVSVADLKKINKLTSDNLFIGQVIKLAPDKIHVVVKGDTVSGICSKYGIDEADFKALNKIVNGALFIGQTVSTDCVAAAASIPALPVAPDWYYPVLPYRLYNNNAGQFLSDGYYREIGAVHPGVDLNGNGGGNTDWGDKIYAASDGIVVDARWYPVWGNIVKIWHPYDKVWTIYAHLEKMHVSIGMSVKGGTVIGTLGRGAGNRYLAHLHFEIRFTDLPTDFWPSGRYSNKAQAEKFTLANYHHPIKYLEKKNAKQAA